MRKKEPEVITIPPGTQFPQDEEQVRSMEEKRQRAIAVLGRSWCLHNPRPPHYKPEPFTFPASLRRER